MIYILGFKSGVYEYTTPVKLAENFDLTFINGLREAHLTDEDYLIRYGCTYFPKRDDKYKVINKALAIRNTVDKLASTKILLENEIPMPKVFFSKDEIKEEDLPVLRRKMRHSRGADIVFVESTKDIPDGDFYTKYIPSKREYRVLVYKDSALRIQLKSKKDESEDDIVKNSKNGYKFRNLFKHKIKIEKEAIGISIKAVKASGLDFGAVDVIVGKDNKIYALEVNSAPRLNRSGRELFIVALFTDLGLEFDMNKCYRIKANDRVSLPLKFVAMKREKKNNEE